MGKLLEIWRRVRQDGGLLVMIALAVGICLLLPQGQEDTVRTSSQEEARLAAVLSAMEGVGKAEVVIRWDETSATMTQSGSRTPTGAVVVAQGAEDIGVRIKLIRAVTTLLQLQPDSVEVFAMEQEREQ